VSAGIDKVIAFDPPGAIGLPVDDALILLRLHDFDAAIPPKDAAGSLDDLLVPSGSGSPDVVDAALGKGRQFSASFATTMAAQDLAPGDSLTTRDCTIQVVLSWNIAAQLAAATAGTVLVRGKANASAEYVSYGLQLEVIDAPSFTGLVRWVWQSTAGVLATPTGASFTLRSGDFTMLTATRRWVSPTEVVLRYYIGDILLSEVTSAAGDIGGGTTGTFVLGAAYLAGVPANFLCGVIDEVLVLDRELTPEEIGGTWKRITLHQPLGVQLIHEMHDKGFPLPTRRDADVELDLRMIGNGLGYAAAKAEQLRTDILPQRAYGQTLADWEEVLRPTPAPASSIDERRARVLARMRQRRGCSIDGIKDILPSLLGGGAVDDLEFIAFSNQIRDSFTTLDPLRWDTAPSTASISIVSGAASFQPGAGSFFLDGATWPPTWVRMRETVGGDGKQAHALVKLVFTTPQANAEAGIYFENAITRDYLLLGLRDLAGSFRVFTQSIVGGVAAAAVQQATIGANPAAIWLHLYQTTADGTWKAAWSTTSATAGYTVSANITHPTTAHWSGCYVRGISALASGPRADFDDHVLYAPFSGRPFSAYVLLDRALGFSPDIEGARSVISAIKHGFVDASFITNPVLLAGDSDGGAGVAPTGGY
jgi:hypothetical protein